MEGSSINFNHLLQNFVSRISKPDTITQRVKKHCVLEYCIRDQSEQSFSQFHNKLIFIVIFFLEIVLLKLFVEAISVLFQFQLLERRSMLLEKSSQRRAILEDSYRLQQFERDCDETKGWINEKLKFATDDSYLVSIKPIQFTVVNININYYGLYSSTILGVFSYFCCSGQNLIIQYHNFFSRIQQI